MSYHLINKIAGFRGDQIWCRPYMNRSLLEPSEHLKELVETEIDTMDGLKKAKVRGFLFKIRKIRKLIKYVSVRKDRIKKK